MSTDRAASRPSFALAFGAVVAVLALAAVALITTAALRPPRLASVAVAPTSLVAWPAQRVVLELDQPIDPDAVSVTVSPDAEHEVVVEDRTITIRFPGMLDYATTYTVVADGVRGRTTGRSTSLTTSFETPDIDVFTLVGHAQTSDRVEDRIIAASATAASSPTIVYRAASIQDFARVGDGLLVLSDEGDGPHVRLIDGDGETKVLDGPADGEYRGLEGSADGRQFGYIVSGGDASRGEYVVADALFVGEAGTGLVNEVTGFGGAPLPVAEWAFIEGTASIVVRTTDLQGYLIDTRDLSAEPVPLGALGALLGFYPGTATLLTEQYPDYTAIDLTTATPSAVEFADVALADGDFLGEFTLVGADSLVRVVNHFDLVGGGGWTGSRLVRVDGDVVTDLYRPAGGVALTVCASPNGRLLAVPVTAVGAQEAPTTYVVDAVSGEVLGGVTGGSPDWCH